MVVVYLNIKKYDFRLSTHHLMMNVPLTVVPLPSFKYHFDNKKIIVFVTRKKKFFFK